MNSVLGILQAWLLWCCRSSVVGLYLEKNGGEFGLFAWCDKIRKHVIFGP